MAYDNPAISASPSGIDPTPFPRSSGVSRFDFTYADFAVAAEVATVKLLALASDRQLLIRGVWVIVTQATSDAVVMGVGDEDTRDGFMRDVALDSLGTKDSDANRGAYFVNGTVPLLGDGTGGGGAVVDPTITLDLSGSSADLDTLTTGAWSVFIDYAWIDAADHPANIEISKAAVGSPPAVATFTRKAKWAIRAYSHDTGSIAHDGTGAEDFELTVEDDVFLIVSCEIVELTGSGAKGLTLLMYLDDARTLLYPQLNGSNFSDSSYFELNADPVFGPQELMFMGADLSSSPANKIYFSLTAANVGGAASTYRITVYTRVLEWVEV